MNLIYVNRDRVPEIWPGVKHLIHRAMERGGLSTFAQIESDVLEGTALLWLAWDGKQVYAAAVTQIVPTEFGHDCIILACGGTESTKWIQLIGGIENYAKASGCDHVRIFGRRGWQAKLPGYQAKRIILEKEI